MTETVMRKDGAEVSFALPPKENRSRRGPKLRLKTREKRPHKADPSLKKVELEPSAQSDEVEGEAESRLMHRKWKISAQAGPQVGVALY